MAGSLSASTSELASPFYALFSAGAWLVTR